MFFKGDSKEKNGEVIMISISGLTIHEQIYESAKTLVYRGHREIDNLPVVVKVHRTDYPSEKEIAKFRREYTIGQLFDCGFFIVN